MRSPSPRQLALGGGIAFALAVLVLLFVATGPAARNAGAANPAPAIEQARSYEPHPAWLDGRQVAFYDFGAYAALDADGAIRTAPIWVFVRGFEPDGTPQMIEGQRTVVDAVPGEPDYSDLWDVHFVIVPDGYDPSPLRSRSAIEESDLEVRVPGVLVNCPLVPLGSTLADGTRSIPTWYDDATRSYFDLGRQSTTPASTWVLVTGFDDGSPLLVADQLPIFEAGLDDPGYAHFQRLHYVLVPAGYEANTIRSARDVAASGYRVLATDVLLNRPQTTDEPTTGGSSY